MKRFPYIILLAILLLITACRQDNNSTANPSLFQEIKDSGLDNINQLSPNEEVNIISYLYYYNGGGVAAGDVNNDGLVDLFFSNNQKKNKLFLNQGDWRFEDVTTSAQVAGQGDWSSGVSMVDINGDGWLDIYVCQVSDYLDFQGHNELYINQKDGSFKEVAEAYGLDFRGFGTQAYWLDYDRDGDLDCYLLNHSIHSNATYGPANNREKLDAKAGDRLLRQDRDQSGQISFQDVSQEAGIYQSQIGYGLSASIADFNDDGWMDIYVANDFSENDYLYLNQGNGQFEEVIRESMGHSSKFSMGSDAADYDNDGQLDLLTLDMKPDDEIILKSSMASDAYSVYRSKELSGYHYQFPRNHLQKNLGQAKFSEVGEWAGVAATDWSWAGLFADLDQDGLQDILVSNGIIQRPNNLDYLKFISNKQLQESMSNLDLASKMPSGLMPNVVFQQEIKGQFVNKSSEWGFELPTSSTGAALADLDGDGDLDLALNNVNAPSQLYRNENQGGNWLQIELVDEQPNRQGIGARIEVYTNGTTQVREVSPVRGFQSSMPAMTHFGLGEIASVDSLLIRWPNGDWYQYNLNEVNQKLSLSRKEGQRRVQNNSATPINSLQAASELGLDYHHQENEYFDFNVEGLQPYALSRLGPAAANIHWQGKEYVFLGGAHDQAGQIFQYTDGKFQALSVPDLEKDLAHEDVDALFFDADGDNDPDLYVVSGGSQIDRQGTEYEDRLYLFDQGSWQRSGDALPVAYVNGSSVTAGDFDGDQDLDLFIGGLSIPGNYGLPGYSYILENNGQGRFNRDTLSWNNQLERLGMVTDAIWLEEEQSLMVAGHWMPVTELKRNKEGWTKTSIKNTQGWWNCLSSIDLDGDGQEELLAGNWGQNSVLKASPETPIRLYVADFDGNQRTDPLLTYIRDSLEYSFFSKDDLSTQIPPLRRNNVAYTEFAKRSFREVMPPAMLANAYQVELNQMASIALSLNASKEWSFATLAEDLQLAPIFSFGTQREGKSMIALGGWLEIQPSIGRQEAQRAWLKTGSENSSWQVLDLPIGLAGRQVLSLSDGKLLLLTNDGPAYIWPN